MKAGDLRRLLIDYQDNDELIAVVFERGTAEAEVEDGVINGRQWHMIVQATEGRTQDFGNKLFLQAIAGVMQ